jgi:hypothetical protein
MRVSLRVVDNEFRAVKRLMYDEGEGCTVVCNRRAWTEYLVKRRVDAAYRDLNGNTVTLNGTSTHSALRTHALASDSWSGGWLALTRKSGIAVFSRRALRQFVLRADFNLTDGTLACVQAA